MAHYRRHFKVKGAKGNKQECVLTFKQAKDLIKEAGFAVERRQVFLDKAIKDLGVYQVKLNLHPEVSQTILVNVARTEDDAKKQAKAYENN